MLSLSKPPKYLGTVANICILLLAVSLIGVLARHYLVKDATKSTGPSDPASGLNESRREVRVGDKLNVSGFTWQPRTHSLLLVMTEGCGYCEAGAPFFKRLIEDQAQRGVKTIALLPQPIDKSAKYLRQLGLEVSTVIQASLPPLGIVGAPSVLLVDGNGTVEGYWLGKVDANGEQVIMNAIHRVESGSTATTPTSQKIQVETNANSRSDRISLDELTGCHDCVLIDIRPRGQFARGHIPSARNIPADEMDIRVDDELDKHSVIVLSCPSCDSDSPTLHAREVLESKGYKVRVLTENVP